MVLTVSMNKELFWKAIASKHVNQRQMARDIGMNPSRLSDMIHDRIKGWKYRRPISLYLGVVQEELFPENGKLNEQFSCQN